MNEAFVRSMSLLWFLQSHVIVQLWAPAVWSVPPVCSSAVLAATNIRSINIQATAALCCTRNYCCTCCTVVETSENVTYNMPFSSWEHPYCTFSVRVTTTRQDNWKCGQGDEICEGSNLRGMPWTPQKYWEICSISSTSYLYQRNQASPFSQCLLDGDIYETIGWTNRYWWLYNSKC